MPLIGRWGEMQILVLNPGSSSIKFSIFSGAAGAGGDVQSEAEGELSGIGGAQAALEFRNSSGDNLADRLGAIRAGSMAEAAALVERAVEVSGLPRAEAVGYRVVHPGPKLKGHQRITPEVLDALREARSFAPLHDPVVLGIIEEMMRRMPEAVHVACFDTVFHETMPEEATVYALPAEVRAEGVRRYGFHGLSCESVMWQLRNTANFPWRGRLVIAHLGSGCSVTACEDGRSVDTTMGLTPMGGVVMGTRPGDLDPGVIFFLLRREGATVDSVESMLNHDAGLKGLAGSSDMRTVEEILGDMDAGDEARGIAEDAFAVWTRSVRRAIGGMAALGGVDGLIFTGGIGEHDAKARDAIAGALVGGHPLIEPWLNRSKEPGLRKISTESSKIAVYVAPAQEDLMIARHVTRMCPA